jgi:hypothetical protein
LPTVTPAPPSTALVAYLVFLQNTFSSSADIATGTDYTVLLSCTLPVGCLLNGHSMVALKINDLVAGAGTANYTLASGSKKVFRARSYGADPALNYAVAKFTVASSNTNDGYFQIGAPGTGGSRGSYGGTDPWEACSFQGNYLWATATVVNGPLRIDAGLTTIGEVPYTTVTIGSVMNLTPSTSLMMVNGMSGGERILRIQVLSYWAGTRLSGRFGTWSKFNSPCSSSSFPSFDYSWRSSVVTRHFSVLPCRLGITPQQTGRFFARLQTDSPAYGSEVQNATFSWADPTIVTPGGVSNATVNVKPGYSVLIKAPADAHYPVTMYLTLQVNGNSFAGVPEISVINPTEPTCAYSGLQSVSQSNPEYSYVLSCASEVVYVNWVTDAPTSDISFEVGAFESAEGPVTLDASVTRTASFTFSGTGSRLRSVILSFPQASVFEYSISSNVSYASVECFDSCVREDCLYVIANSKKELRVTSFANVPQLVTVNLTSIGRERCIPLPADHICFGLYDSVAADLSTVPYDTMSIVNRAFPATSSTCREAIRRTACASSITPCAPSGAYITPPCREQCKYDVATACPELPHLLSLTACPFNPTCTRAQNPFFNDLGGGTFSPRASPSQPGGSGPSQGGNSPSATSNPSTKSNTNDASGLLKLNGWALLFCALLTVVAVL